MSKTLALIETWVNRISSWTAGTLVVLMVWLVMYEVVMRYFLNKPAGIADEIGSYMFVGIVFLGLAYTMKEHAHIKVSLLTDKLPAKLANWLRVLTLFAFLGYGLTITKTGWDMTLFSYQHNARSGSWLLTPIYLVQIAMPIGTALLSLQLIFEIQRALGKARRGPQT